MDNFYNPSKPDPPNHHICQSPKQLSTVSGMSQTLGPLDGINCDLLPAPHERAVLTVTMREVGLSPGNEGEIWEPEKGVRT